MKERYRKQKFLKNVGLGPIKNTSSAFEENEYPICKLVCFYYFDENAQVICRGCYKSFKTWLDFRKHFNTQLCHITETNYKLNTYNDVYKKYKLRKAKTKKKINDKLSAAQLMDLETLNTRKTRKRCYTNTRVTTKMSKSLSDSGSSSSEKTVKTMKKEALENCVSSDESIAELKHKAFNRNTVEDIPSSTKNIIPNLPHDNQSTITVKTEWNANNISQASSGKNSSASSNCLPNCRPKESQEVKYHYQYYVCVICDQKFTSKCLLTMHQVQHIKSDRSSYGVFMASLAARSA